MRDDAGHARGVGIGRPFSEQRAAIASVQETLAAWVTAALGYLKPEQGAFEQETMDVAVILSALRIAPHEPALMKPQADSTGQADIPEGATP